MIAPIALALGATVAAHGGFFPRGQLAFAVLAAAAAVAAVVASDAPLRGARDPIVVMLIGLGLVVAASAAWTVAEPEAALRWGGVVCGYGLVALASYLAAARIGAVPLAIMIAVVAAAAGVVGLYGAGARVDPLAQRLGGQWSAGGPLEYPPALALAQISALPILLAGACSTRPERWIPAASALGLAVAGAVLALAGSRVQLGLGVLCVAAVVGFGAPRLEIDRRLMLAAAALAVTAGGLADAAAGSYARPFVTGDDLPRLAGLFAIVAGAPLLWALQRRLLQPARGGGRVEAASPKAWNRRGWALVVVPALLALALAASTADSGPEAEPISGFSHGRAELVEAAVETGLDRPLQGSGAQAFFEASISHQEPPPVRFAHNLPLEGWAELGLVGAVLILAIYAYTVRLAWMTRVSAACWLLAPAAIAFLIANLFDWSWHIPASGALFAVAVGGLAGSIAAGPGHDSG